MESLVTLFALWAIESVLKLARALIDRVPFFKVIPKHLEQEIKNNFDWYIRAACVNIVQ